MRRRVNAKKVEERAALIGVYVNSLIMKTKNCCSCSEGFVLLMQREQRQSCTCVHLRAPVCVCLCVTLQDQVCSLPSPLSVTCSLITTATAVRLVPKWWTSPSPISKMTSQEKHNKVTVFFLFFFYCVCVMHFQGSLTPFGPFSCSWNCLVFHTAAQLHNTEWVSEGSRPLCRSRLTEFG